MKIWFDTEFIEDGRTIDLISIGMVAEDGREYYAEVAECDHSRADPWVVENVLPQLIGKIKFREEIAKDIVEFCGPSPEVWAYYADYDWVALCLEQARRLPPMTPEQREEQRRSFAYGNTAIENPRITREMIDRIADETPASQGVTAVADNDDPCPQCNGEGHIDDPLSSACGGRWFRYCSCSAA